MSDERQPQKAHEIAREHHHAIVEVGRDQPDACAHASEHQFGAYNKQSAL